MGNGLSSIFQDNEKVNVWYHFASNLEWSTDLKDLIHEEHVSKRCEIAVLVYSIEKTNYLFLP